MLIDSSYVQVVKLLYRDSMYTMPAAHNETFGPRVYQETMDELVKVFRWLRGD